VLHLRPLCWLEQLAHAGVRACQGLQRRGEVRVCQPGGGWGEGCCILCWVHPRLPGARSTGKERLKTSMGKRGRTSSAANEEEDKTPEARV
jgi:hypothetical protein